MNKVYKTRTKFSDNLKTAVVGQVLYGSVGVSWLSAWITLGDKFKTFIPFKSKIPDDGDYVQDLRP